MVKFSASTGCSPESNESWKAKVFRLWAIRDALEVVPLRQMQNRYRRFPYSRECGYYEESVGTGAMKRREAIPGNALLPDDLAVEAPRVVL